MADDDLPGNGEHDDFHERARRLQDQHPHELHADHQGERKIQIALQNKGFRRKCLNLPDDEDDHRNHHGEDQCCRDDIFNDRRDIQKQPLQES